MLIVDDLKTAMMNATYRDMTQNAMKNLGDAIAEYLLKNTEFMFSWDGENADGRDPVIAAKGTFISLSISLSPTGTNNPVISRTILSTEITAGVTSGKFTISDPGFSTTSVNMGSISPLTLTFNGATRDALYESFAFKIVSWMQSLIPAATCNGSHGGYTGSGRVLKVQ